MKPIGCRSPSGSPSINRAAASIATSSQTISPSPALQAQRGANLVGTDTDAGLQVTMRVLPGAVA